MKKIVINKCYGGFSLSPAAIRELATLKGRECYFFKQDYSNGGLDSPMIPISDKEAENQLLIFHAYDIPDPNKIRSIKSWHEMNESERRQYNEEYNKHSLNSRPDERDDPDLIAVIEKLGEAKSSGSLAKLSIVEIPDDVQWEIEEYDGIEWIAEKHNTWG